MFTRFSGLEPDKTGDHEPYAQGIHVLEGDDLEMALNFFRDSVDHNAPPSMLLCVGKFASNNINAEFCIPDAEARRSRLLVSAASTAQRQH